MYLCELNDMFITSAQFSADFTGGVWSSYNEYKKWDAGVKTRYGDLRIAFDECDAMYRLLDHNTMTVDAYIVKRSQDAVYYALLEKWPELVLIKKHLDELTYLSTQQPFAGYFRHAKTVDQASGQDVTTDVGSGSDTITDTESGNDTKLHTPTGSITEQTTPNTTTTESENTYEGSTFRDLKRQTQTGTFTKMTTNGEVDTDKTTYGHVNTRVDQAGKTHTITDARGIKHDITVDEYGAVARDVIDMMRDIMAGLEKSLDDILNNIVVDNICNGVW